MIPAVVISEVLIRLPIETHITVANLFQRSFIVEPFDTPCALHCARMWKSKADAQIVKQIQADIGATNRQIKADAMIVATAIAKNAICIYSHDHALKNFALGYMDVLDMSQSPPTF